MQPFEVNRIINSDCIEGLKQMPDESVNCCITSPPYFGLRDYGHEGQIGLEGTPDAFVSKMVEVFTEVKRVLRKDGTLWLNLGDSYAGSGRGNNPNGKQGTNKGTCFNLPANAKHRVTNPGSSTLQGGKKNQANAIRAHENISTPGLKSKDLIGIPWMVAFALRSSGWYLRQDIIWHKPNPMPESVTDRCTKAHEYIFLLSKSQKYYYDADAIRTASKNPLDDIRRLNAQSWDNKNTPDELRNGIRPKKVKIPGGWDRGDGSHGTIHREGRTSAEYQITEMKDGANKRSVWGIPTMPYNDAHFATFPEDLIVDCIKAGCPENGLILDPFMGAGTTALVASKLNRNFIGFELNQEYIEIAKKRLQSELGMFNKLIA